MARFLSRHVWHSSTCSPIHSQRVASSICPRWYRSKSSIEMCSRGSRSLCIARPGLALLSYKGWVLTQSYEATSGGYNKINPSRGGMGCRNEDGVNLAIRVFGHELHRL